MLLVHQWTYNLLATAGFLVKINKIDYKLHTCAKITKTEKCITHKHYELYGAATFSQSNHSKLVTEKEISRDIMNSYGKHSFFISKPFKLSSELSYNENNISQQFPACTKADPLLSPNFTNICTQRSGKILRKNKTQMVHELRAMLRNDCPEKVTKIN